MQDQDAQGLVSSEAFLLGSQNGHLLATSSHGFPSVHSRP